MPQLFDKTPGGTRRGPRKVAGPPMPVRHEATPHGQKVESIGTPPGEGITPDAKVRQKVLNQNADQRRENREGVKGPPTAEPMQVAPPPTRAATPLGTPPEPTAAPRVPASQVAEMSARRALGLPDPAATAAQPAPPVTGASGGNANVASPDIPPGAERQQVAKQGAQAQVASGQIPEPPVQMDEQGNMEPAPGLSPEQAMEDASAQEEALANQAKPEPPMQKSPLGRESPIEQADAAGKLRAGQKHHLRALGLSQPGMDPQTAKAYEKAAVRDMELFGEYDGMDDPHAPPPPIRPGKHSFNPKTGQFVSPEGSVSVLDRMMGSRISGPPGG